MRRARAERAFVMSTLVRPDMRARARQLAKELDVAYVDLIGDLLEGLQGWLSDARFVGEPGRMHRADASYFQRIDALEFTVAADDGQEPHRLLQADIVLLGVSRAGKTPLSTYLAQSKGFFVANVPLVLDRPLPEALHRVDPQRVFGLTIEPDALLGIRRARLSGMMLPGRGSYADRDYVLAELEYAERLFRSHPQWPVIDVTGRAVEETAHQIIEILRDRGIQARAAGSG
jgi:regulator of PEP synthase PpsR (kinase-PPPase family)